MVRSLSEKHIPLYLVMQTFCPPIFERQCAHAEPPAPPDAVPTAVIFDLDGVIRDWNDEAAKKQLLKFFEAFGPMDPATVAGRRKLSAAWFS